MYLDPSRYEDKEEHKKAEEEDKEDAAEQEKEAQEAADAEYRLALDEQDRLGAAWAKANAGKGVAKADAPKAAASSFQRQLQKAAKAPSEGSKMPFRMQCERAAQWLAKNPEPRGPQGATKVLQDLQKEKAKEDDKKDKKAKEDAKEEDTEQAKEDAKEDAKKQNTTPSKKKKPGVKPRGSAAAAISAAASAADSTTSATAPAAAATGALPLDPKKTSCQRRPFKSTSSPSESPPRKIRVVGKAAEGNANMAGADKYALRRVGKTRDHDAARLQSQGDGQLLPHPGPMDVRQDIYNFANYVIPNHQRIIELS